MSLIISQIPKNVHVMDDPEWGVTEMEVRYMVRDKTTVGVGPKKEWLIDGMIGRQDIVFIYGQPGTGKTFIAIDLLMSAANGKPFAGQFCVKSPLNVAIAVGEGGTSIDDRFEAAMKYHELANWANYSIIDDGPQFYEDNEGEEIDALIREWKTFQREPLDILIIDTYAMATVGADENSAKATGKVIANARKIAREMNCAIIFVHHTTKNGSSERGSSALRAAADMMIEIGDKQIRCTKAKHCTAWKPIDFKLVPFEESLVVEWSNAKESQLTQRVLKLLQDNSDTQFTSGELIEHFKSYASQMTVRSALRKLADEKLIIGEPRNPNAQVSKANPVLYFVNMEEW